MDAAGNIGLAFNTSGTAVYPSVRYTGRLVSDPLGMMGQGEAIIIAGSEDRKPAPTIGWGDYSMLAVDPVDGCTFWATLEYQAITDNAPWQTRVAAFRFPNCGTTTSKPSAPTNLAAAAISSSQINLSWTDTSSDETGFTIERCVGEGCTSFSSIATVGAGVTTYSNTGLTPATTYSYRVSAYNAGGDSAYSNTATGTTPASTTVPAAPSSLKAVAAAKGTINLSWVDKSTNETRFEIARTPGTTITIAPDLTTYKDVGLTKGQTYTYTVRACNGAGCSVWSNTASARAK